MSLDRQLRHVGGERNGEGGLGWVCGWFGRPVQRRRLPEGRCQHVKLRCSQNSVDSDGTPLSSLSPGDTLAGKVVFAGGGKKNSWINAGVVHQTKPTSSETKSILARLPPSRQGPYPRKHQKLTVEVRKVQLASARLEVRRIRPTSKNLRCSDLPPAKIAIEDLKTGQEMKNALVVAVYKFGALVDVDTYRTGGEGKQIRIPGLLKREHFLETWGSSLDLYTKDTTTLVVQVGISLDLFVRAAYPATGRFSLSAYPMTPDQVEQERIEAKREAVRQRRRRQRTLLKPGQERTGTVKGTPEFGAFIDIGATRDGLVHVGQLVDMYKFSWKEKLARGTRVKVSILECSKTRIDLQLIGTEDELEKAAEEAKANPTSPALARSSPTQRSTNDTSSPKKAPKIEEKEAKEVPLFDVDELDDDEFSEYLDI